MDIPVRLCIHEYKKSNTTDRNVHPTVLFFTSSQTDSPFTMPTRSNADHSFLQSSRLSP